MNNIEILERQEELLKEIDNLKAERDLLRGERDSLRRYLAKKKKAPDTLELLSL